MSKSNNQRDTDAYQKEMAEMRARMAKMQEQLDKMSAKQDGAKPKTHLAALPKKKVETEKKPSDTESVLAAANAKQEAVLSHASKPQATTSQRSAQKASVSRVAEKKVTTKRQTREQAPLAKAKPAPKASAKPTTPKVRTKSASQPTSSQARATKVTSRPAANVSQSASDKTEPVAKHLAQPTKKQVRKPVFPGSTATPSRHATSIRREQLASQAVKAPKISKSHSTAKSSAVANVAKVTKPASTQQPPKAAKPASDNQSQKIDQMGKDINKLLAQVGMNENDAKDLSQTYFYFISLIDNGQLVDQGRIITFNTKKMNHRGVVHGKDGEYYLDLEYLSKPHPKADALPMPDGYVVNLAEAKTLPDVVTKNPSVSDAMDSKIKLGGTTTIDMPEASKDSGFYIPLSKLNGGKIPVHRVSQTDDNGSTHEAFVSSQPSRQMTLRHSAPKSNNPTDIHFGPAEQPSADHNATARREPQHQSSRTELRRERNHHDSDRNHVGLGHALGTMFGFGSRR